jgi:hypothetical protein
LVTLLIFSGLDPDGARAMLLSQVCSATITKVNLYHSLFVSALARNLFSVFQGQSRTIFHMSEGRNVHQDSV